MNTRYCNMKRILRCFPGNSMILDKFISEFNCRLRYVQQGYPCEYSHSLCCRFRVSGSASSSTTCETNKSKSSLRFSHHSLVSCWCAATTRSRLGLAVRVAHQTRFNIYRFFCHRRSALSPKSSHALFITAKRSDGPSTLPARCFVNS